MSSARMSATERPVSLANRSISTAVHAFSNSRGKAACKAELQRELRLPRKADAPVLGSIGRLAEQKGTSLILAIADDLIAAEPDCQLVVLGEGDASLESALRRLEARRPENVRVRIGYDDRLAHRIEAGGDIFLLPSPCQPS